VPISGGRGQRPPTSVGISGIKISAEFSFFSSQSTRVTDGQTDRRTDRQNYDPQDCASIAASRGKKLLDDGSIPLD